MNKVNIKDYDQLLIIVGSKVVGTVGLMMCKIMEVKEESLTNKGIYLGIAMQLTNIARDIKEDLESGRIYFPEEIRNSVNCHFSKLLNDNELQIKFKKDLKLLLDISDQIYCLAWEGVMKLPVRYRIPIAIASYLYQSIGKKLEKITIISGAKESIFQKLEKVIKTIKVFFKLIFDKRRYYNNDF